MRNTRKHYLKCVDCGCQTLPRNATEQRPWTAAGLLRIVGHINDGPLCFICANERRRTLGLPLLTGATVLAVAASTGQLTQKHVRINSRDCCWEVDTLESVVARWSEECFPRAFKNKDPRLLLVAVNNLVIRAKDFNSTPISEGDEITIVVGAIAGG
jgi:molybdopterin converting factor small subunit